MTNVTAPFEPATFSVQEMVAVAFRQWRKILGALLFWPAIAVTLLLILPPKYRAQSDLLVKTGREYLAEGDGSAGMTAPTSTKQEGINSEITLLTGRAVVESAISDIGLGNIYPGLIDNPPWFNTILDEAVHKFSKDLTAEPIKLSNIIAVSFDASSPGKAKMILDRLVRIYIDKHTQVFAGGEAESYNEAIQRDVAEMAGLEQQRTLIKLRGGVYDIAAQRAALIAQRVAAESHLQDVVNSHTMLQGRVWFLKQELPTLPPAARSTATDRNEAADHARQTVIDLRATEAAMAARYAPGNPDLLRVRDQIAALTSSAHSADRVNVASTPNPLVQQVSSEIMLGEAQLAPLAAEETRYIGLVANLGNELDRLERADLDLRTTSSRIDSLADNLKLAQARYDQARTQEQMNAARQVSVVQVAPAIAADRPAKPSKPLFLAAGFLLGMFSAGAIAVLAILTGQTVVTEDGLERLLGLPVLLALPAGRDLRDGPVTLSVE